MRKSFARSEAIVRFHIKTILIVIVLLAPYMAFARPFLGDGWGLLALAMVTILVGLPFVLAVIYIAYFEPNRPIQRPTAEDRSPQ